MARGGDTHSPWRRAARNAIAAALAPLPADSTPRQRRAAVRDAYPFAERRGWAYQCWLAEVRLALGPARPPKKEPPPCVRVRLMTRDGVTPWLEVVCTWCGGREE